LPEIAPVIVAESIKSVSGFRLTATCLKRETQTACLRMSETGSIPIVFHDRDFCYEPSKEGGTTGNRSSLCATFLVAQGRANFL